MGNETLEYRDFRTPPDVLVARMAARQHGLITVEQLRAVGLDKSAIARRVGSGRLHRVGRGVYAVGHAALSREARFLAAVLTAGEGAALSHEACAEHWQVRRQRASLIDVVVPSRRRVRTSARLHRTTLHPDDHTLHKGIPVTTIARLVVDLTDHLTSWEITNVIHEAAFRNLFRLDETYAAIRRGNGRRIRAAKRAVQMHLDGSAGIRSRSELKVLIALEREHLPEPRVNTVLNGHEVDFHWPRLGLAVEFDGSGHERARTQAEDAHKERAWKAAGYEVLRFGDPYAVSHAVDLRARRP